MNETKHTPGPWTATPSYINLGEWEIYGNEDGDNAQHIGSIEAEGTEQAEANARLIAAAPDLLEACESMLGFLSADTLDLRDYEQMESEVKRVIAKAKGE